MEDEANKCFGKQVIGLLEGHLTYLEGLTLSGIQIAVSKAVGLNVEGLGSFGLRKIKDNSLVRTARSMTMCLNVG